MNVRFMVLVQFSDSEGLPVSLIVKVKGEQTKFVISVKNSLAIVHWDGLSTKSLKPEVIVNLESSDSATRINDGKCDPSNRLWAGRLIGVFLLIKINMERSC